MDVAARCTTIGRGRLGSLKTTAANCPNGVATLADLGSRTCVLTAESSMRNGLNISGTKTFPAIDPPTKTLASEFDPFLCNFSLSSLHFLRLLCALSDLCCGMCDTQLASSLHRNVCGYFPFCRLQHHRKTCPDGNPNRNRHQNDGSQFQKSKQKRQLRAQKRSVLDVRKRWCQDRVSRLHKSGLLQRKLSFEIKRYSREILFQRRPSSPHGLRDPAHR